MTSDDFQTETPVHDHNRRAWDARVRRKSTFTRPVEESDFADPLAAVDGVGWLGGNIRDRQVLCLAAGGARLNVAGPAHDERYADASLEGGALGSVE